MGVEASDGYLGQVGELVIDPNTGIITHFTLLEGHALGKRAVTLPVSAVDKMSGESVFLNLSKADVEVLPALPVKRSYGFIQEGKSVEMVAIRFQALDRAAKELKEMKDLVRRGTFKLLNAAVFVKDEKGVLTVHESGDLGPKRGSVFGAITGGLMGIFAGPGGMIAGALIGAGVGGVTAKHYDAGFDNDFLQVLGDRLLPGQSGLLILLEHEWLDSFVNYMSGIKEVFSRQTLTGSMVEQLLNPPEER